MSDITTHFDHKGNVLKKRPDPRTHEIVHSRSAEIYAGGDLVEAFVGVINARRSRSDMGPKVWWRKKGDTSPINYDAVSSARKEGPHPFDKLQDDAVKAGYRDLHDWYWGIKEPDEAMQ